MIYEFNQCLLDTNVFTLYRAGEVVKLRPKVFAVLMYLMAHRERVVSKNELCEQVWPDQSISNSALESTIRLVRSAVGDNGRAQNVIQTFHRFGYRFIADIEEKEYQPAEAQPESHLLWRQQPWFNPAGGAPERFPFLGRDKEIEILCQFVLEVENGRGQVFVMEGDIGLGKSRLLDELHRVLKTRRLRWLMATGYAGERQSPLWLVRGILRQYFDITREMDHAAIHARMSEALADIQLEVASYRPFLLYLLGIEDETALLKQLSPESLESRCIASFRELLFAHSRFEPIVLLLDDMQQMDEASAIQVASLIECVSDVPIVLIGMCETGGQPAWMEIPDSQRMTLVPLEGVCCLRMAQALAPRFGVPEALLPELVTKAAGNPLSLYTIMLALAEQEGGGQTIPNGFEEALFVRLDHLPSHLQHYLHLAAILSSGFSFSILRELVEDPKEVEDAILYLQKLGWLSLYHHSFESLWNFSHMSWQAAVYDHLTSNERTDLHIKVGQRIQDIEKLGNSFVYFVEYYSQSQNIEKAFELISAMITLKKQYFAYNNAIEIIYESINFLKKFPKTRKHKLIKFRLHIELAEIFYIQCRFVNVINILLSYLLDIEELNDHLLSLKCLILLSQAYRRGNQWREAVKHAQRIVKMSNSDSDVTILSQAYAVLAMERYVSADPMQSIVYGKDAIHILNSTSEVNLLGDLYIVLAMNYLLVGDFTAAYEYADYVGGIARLTQDKSWQATAVWMTGWIDATSGHAEQAIRDCRPLIETCPEGINRAIAAGIVGYALLEHGAFIEAVEYLDEALRLISHVSLPRLQSWFLVLRGEAALAQGHDQQAQELGTEGLKLASEKVHRVGMAWAQRMLGKGAMARGQFDEAATLLRQALAHFAAIPAHFEVGQSHLVLAELAYMQSMPEVTAHHLRAANDLWDALHVPMHMARLQQKAQRFGIDY